ncbi:MAG: holo-ACP synthase [Phycisphaeraceae bacterium]|nr:holo-ACP synthase [Phycisphaeraceae bacterium]MCW5754440.1 holo-ACP synthase [Phycisphaeraceae bacterium]
MPILGHGIDLVSVSRIGAMIDRHGAHFLGRVFTLAEQSYCERNAKRRLEHYAARFAAKEAVLKALGTGWRDGIAWTDVEVVLEPSGKPTIALTGRASSIALSEGVTTIHLSLSHTGDFATASAIAERQT